MKHFWQLFQKSKSLFWLALVFITVGYVLLGRGDITLAPMLLVTGYCVMLPLFLWFSFRGGSGE